MTASDFEPFDLPQRLGAALVERDVLRVSGPDAAAYLHGQLSQDVEQLAVEATAWSFVLQPTGKVDAWVRVTRTGDDTFLLDVDGGSGDALAARLRRFLLRTKAEVEALDWRCVTLRGPGARDAADNATVPAELRVAAGWPGVEGADLLGPEVELPTGIPVVGQEDLEALRIVSGVPAMGAELTDKTIPAETGQWLVELSVDFTKGCFTGQELVARIDSRGGNVPRHLRGLVVEGEVRPEPGAAVTVGGAQVGTITSSAPVAGFDGFVALAYIGRAVEPPADAQVEGPNGPVRATIRTLPL